MKVFEYKVVNSHGKAEIGLIKAANKQKAEHILRSRKIEVTKLEQKKVIFDKIIGKLSSSKLNDTEKSNLYQKLATMLDAGINLIRALEVISESENPNIEAALDKVTTDVRAGSPFSTACAKYPKLFNKIEINIIRSGEATGNLSKVLKKMSEESGKIAALKRSLQSAMVYPIIVTVSIFAVIIIVMRNVIPIVDSIYKEAGSELPKLTRMMIFINDAISNYWFFIAPALIIMVLALIAFVRLTLFGDYLWSLFKMKVAIFGPIHRAIVMTEFTNGLSMMLSNGVPIIEATRLASGTITNAIFKLSMEQVVTELENGNPMSATMDVFPNLYPNMVVNMISVGEESGSLHKMLDSIAIYYGQEVDTKIKSLSSAFEPLMVVLLGVTVAIVVLAVMLPIYNLSSVYN